MPHTVEAKIQFQVLIDKKWREPGPGAEAPRFLALSSHKRREVMQYFLDQIRPDIQRAPRTTRSWTSVRMEVDDQFGLTLDQVRGHLERQLALLKEESNCVPPDCNPLRVNLAAEVPPQPKLTKCSGEDLWAFSVTRSNPGPGRDWTLVHKESGVTATVLVTIQWEVPKTTTANEKALSQTGVT